MSLLAKCLAGVAFATIGAATASADIVIVVGPGNFPDDEEVLYNRPFLLDNGPLVQGVTNQSSFVVDFFGAGEDLTTPALGQARIEGADGSFTQMTIALDTPNATFQTLIFNVDVCNDQTDGQLTINVAVAGNGTVSQTFAIDANGENFFRLEAIDPQSIANVSFSSDVELCDLQQVRIGGVAGAVPIPLPGAAVSGAVLLGAGAIARRLRRI